MGVKVDKKYRFVEWWPKTLYTFHLTKKEIEEAHRKNRRLGARVAAVCICQRILPPPFRRNFTRANWVALRAAMTAYLTLVLYLSPAYAEVKPAGLDALVPQIIAAESSGKPGAIGDHGRARGLMQIQKATWEAFSDYPWDDAFDEEKNVQVGRAILERIAEVYRGKLGGRATPAHIVYTYNTGRYAFGPLPSWTKKHPNDIYRSIFNGKS